MGQEEGRRSRRGRRMDGVRRCDVESYCWDRWGPHSEP